MFIPRGAETFVILDGAYTFYRGDEIIHAVAGGSMSIPANVPHRFVAGPDGGKVDDHLPARPRPLLLGSRHRFGSGRAELWRRVADRGEERSGLPRFRRARALVDVRTACRGYLNFLIFSVNGAPHRKRRIAELLRRSQQSRGGGGVRGHPWRPPRRLIGPPRVRLTSAERLREIMRTAPSVDDAFAGDLRTIRAESGPAPGSRWPS